jgi:hypothetical protein
MAIYATSADLAAYLAATREDLPAPTDQGALEALLIEAQQDVDVAVGPFPKLASGLALDPSTLTAPQQAALRRATCAAAEFRLDSEDESGATEFLAGPLTVGWRGSRPPGPKVIEALAGYGLIRHSGCAAPSPEPPPPPIVEGF